MAEFVVPAVIAALVFGIIRLVEWSVAQSHSQDMSAQMDKVLECLKIVEDKVHKNSHTTNNMKVAMDDLHDQHAVTDEDGRPIWYVPQAVFRDILDTLRNIERKMERGNSFGTRDT